MSCVNTPLKVVALGTYDKGKPRVRILLRGLRENGVEVIECHREIWTGVEDKSQVRGVASKLLVVARFLLAYPALTWRYLRLPKHDVVLIGYLGLFDVLVLWPLIRMRRAYLVWDVFLSLYNTVVEDRALVGRHHPFGVALWTMEWLALRLVDLALMDTQTHADYLRETYGCASNKVASILVGAEPEAFDLSKLGLQPVASEARPLRVLFYGQFIPLHGIETVVRAAKLTEDRDIHWLLIGKGQEAQKIRHLVDELRPTNLEWLEWVQYEELIAYLARCHVALGIFGTSDKAARVIPNKVYQILTAGRPLITGDTPGARELLVENHCVTLVPVGSVEALADAVSRRLLVAQTNCVDERLRQRIAPKRLGAELLQHITGERRS